MNILKKIGITFKILLYKMKKKTQANRKQQQQRQQYFNITLKTLMT